ncbi:MAG: hypothetical protein LPK00_03005 [Bacillaceae bacterium]|nr:hypothetical protein [Bacillaceae bacterium]
MKNYREDNGYILVITMAFSLFLSALLLYHIDLFTTEKQFAFEVNETYKLQNMVTVCVDELINEFLQNGIKPSNMQKQFPSGNVNITVTGIHPIFFIKLNASTHLGRNYEVTIELDLETKEIISWKEL